MKTLFIAFFSSFLLTWVSTSSQRYKDFNLSDADDIPPDEVRDFFRLLLLSRYGHGAPDYADIEGEKPLIDRYYYSSGAAKMVPFRNAVQNYVDWKKQENFPYQEDQFKHKTQSIHTNQHIKKKQRSNNEDTSNSKTEENTTSSGPDLLASIPPVTPNKGQKEYVMLRPPVDNHRKIEHWMQSMTNGIFGVDHHLIQKRGSVQAATKEN